MAERGRGDQRENCQYRRQGRPADSATLSRRFAPRKGGALRHTCQAVPRTIIVCHGTPLRSPQGRSLAPHLLRCPAVTPLRTAQGRSLAPHLSRCPSVTPPRTAQGRLRLGALALAQARGALRHTGQLFLAPCTRFAPPHLAPSLAHNHTDPRDRKMFGLPRNPPEPELRSLCEEFHKTVVGGGRLGQNILTWTRPQTVSRPLIPVRVRLHLSVVTVAFVGDSAPTSCRLLPLRVR
jgi:hypothetical protein